MRRSRQVLAPLLASAAVTMLTACRPTQPQRCVDEQGHETSPMFCANLPQNGTGSVAGNMSNNGGYYNNGVWIPHYYRYYYGGSSGGFGTFVTGGSYAPRAGTSYSIGGTTRGGFGSSFSEGGGHGSGASE